MQRPSIRIGSTTLKKGAIAFYEAKKEYPNARWDLYVAQMHEVETAYQKGEVQTTYVSMNRFMDMLKAREGGIPVQPANELFNLCNFLMPPEFHDVTRQAGLDTTILRQIPAKMAGCF